MIHQACADGRCAGSGARLGTIKLVEPPEVYQVVSWEQPRRPMTPAVKLTVGLPRALDWLTRQHLYAWIRQPELTPHAPSTRVDIMEHNIKTDRAPSRSRVGESVTWTCSCGEPVGTTWRDSDGLHAESAWQGAVQGTPGDWSTYSYARDLAQTVARAREHLSNRHALDLEQRNDESAITAESPSQGQTVPPADAGNQVGASQAVNSDDQPDFDDILRQLVHDSIAELVEEIAGKAGIRRPTSLQLALVYDTVAKVAAAGRDRAARAALNSDTNGAQLARALGVSRQAVHKKYAVNAS